MLKKYYFSLTKYFLGRGERYLDIQGNNIGHATYMTDADTNLLDTVDSDTSLNFEEAVQHDAEGSYKVLILFTFDKSTNIIFIGIFLFMNF